VPVDGGYRVTGRWPFASGSPDSAWLAGNCLVLDGDLPRPGPAGAPEVLYLFFPAADCEILDTWYTGGLRGTGSHDFAVTDAFVPAHRAMSIRETRSTLTGPLYRGAVATWQPQVVAAVALGIARAAIEALKELAAAKIPTFQTDLLREHPHVRMEVARAEALVRSARSFFYESVGDAWATASAGQDPPEAQLMTMRLAIIHAAESALRAVELMYQAAGSTSVYTSSPLDRCLRDVQVACRHTAVGPRWLEAAGRFFLDVPPA
jgi:alkylation response protein AidB-like acyl-CoA dehydrogenase